MTPFDIKDLPVKRQVDEVYRQGRAYPPAERSMPREWREPRREREYPLSKESLLLSSCCLFVRRWISRASRIEGLS